MKRGKSLKKNLWKKNISGWLLILPTLLLFYYIVWRPIAIGAHHSFFSMSGYSVQEFVGLQNYKDVISDTTFIQTFWNTCKYVLWSLVIGFPLPFIAAVMLNEMVHGKGFFKFSMYFPAIIPGIAVSLIWFFVYEPGRGGLLNMLLYYLGQEPFTWLQSKEWTIPLIVVSMSWSGFGGTMIMYLASLQGVNSELYEAARLDGAGFFQRIRYVLLPHMYGVMLLLLIRQIIGVFQVMEQPLAMTGGGPNNASNTLALQNYNYAFVYYQVDKALALGMVIFLMLAVLTVVYFILDKKVEQ